MSLGGYNAGIDHGFASYYVKQYSVNQQASSFAQSSRLFAPFYRQATIATFYNGGKLKEEMQKDFVKAYNLAKSDVVRAFEYYLQNENNGRPFVIAGHSQGAWLASELLKYLEDKPEKSRVVAAYLIGNAISYNWLEEEAPSFPICNSPSSIGCVVAWNTFDEFSDASPIKKFAQHVYKGGFRKNNNKKIICTNPVSWKSGNTDWSSNSHPCVIITSKRRRK